MASQDEKSKALPQAGDIYDVPASGSLGLLALGAAGLKAWREKRKEMGLDPSDMAALQQKTKTQQDTQNAEK